MDALSPGFANPVHDAQGCFRRVMEAFARPARPLAFETGLRPPAPLTPELAAIALTLGDPDAPLWLDPTLGGSADVAAYLRFHTGAPIVADPGDAVFALVTSAAALPDFADFAQGSDAYPDRSTTIVVALDALTEGGDDAIAFRGPGILGEARLGLSPMPGAFALRLAANARLFPRGVDLLLVAPGRIAALPRSSRPLEAR